MTTILLRPSPLALGISKAYGTCRPQPETPLRWAHCPECFDFARRNPGVRRMTICKTCDGSARLGVM